jgi:glycerol-3-phosphate dehydrogenase
MPVLNRAHQLAQLRDQAFDVLVIGGGISGAAVARDAARRGLRTGLIEARDFAEGTSSRSSRLVHGGLRYLEHFELDLVFEGSQERRRLLRIAPHLVRPLEFFFPIFEAGRIGRVKLDAGMWLYDALSLFRNIERHQMLDADALLESEPGLRSEDLLGGARYFDAQVDDARLVITTVIGAIEAGAAMANRAEALEIDTSNWPGHRVVARDVEGGAEWPIDALAVVNATGPWVDETLRRTGTEMPGTLVPTRGTHIHIPQERLGHSHAFIFESPSDGRVMFVLPWRDLTLIGTTDDSYDGAPEDVTPTREDVQYLLASTNYLFPGAELTEADVISAWAGLRPLVAEGDGDDDAGEGEVSRDFTIREDPPGLFTLAGGKLTSHRAMAEETVDRIVPFLAKAGVKPVAKCDTARVALPGGNVEDLAELKAHVRRDAAELGVSEEGADRLTRAYGLRAGHLLELVRRQPELASPILEGRPHIGAEAIHAVRAEMALHIEDVLFRRTRIGLETRDDIEDAARRAGLLMATELGWTKKDLAGEVRRTTEIRQRDDRAWREPEKP